MSEILNLEPKAVWKHFYDITQVPRPSKKEEKIRAFLVGFGKSLNLETVVDGIGNVIIKKPATAGMEDRKTLVLQCHMDMVCQKNSDVDFDFDTMAIQTYVTDDGFVKAKGTTLGADNGLGDAAIMAVLESNDIPHPALEALFTVDEETGMTGAIHLDPNVLDGRILLNLDTEDDDMLTIGCAGGMDVSATKKYDVETLGSGYTSILVEIAGLMGGHSGGEIQYGRGNSNKLLSRFLMESLGFDAQIAKMDSGGLRNAIPREGSFIISLPKDKEQDLIQELEKLKTDILNEYLPIEPDLRIEIGTTKFEDKVASKEETKKLAYALRGAFNGLYRWSAELENTKETSNNIANVVVGDGEMKILCLARSALESGKKDISDSLRAVFELADFNVEYTGGYPGWKPNPDAEITKVLVDQYKDLFGEEPRVVVTHGGLECGLIGSHYPDMEMISFGPNIYGPHSPDERAEIKSVQKFWKYLLEILKNAPKKD